MAGTKPTLSNGAPAKPGTLTTALQQEALWVIEWAEHELTNRLDLDSDWDAAECREVRAHRKALARLRQRLSGPLSASGRSLLQEACYYARDTFATHETAPDANEAETAANKQRVEAFEEQLVVAAPQQTL